MTAFWTPDQQALAPYLQAKHYAEKCVQIIAGSLQPGMTVADCEQLMRDWLRAHQVFDPARPPRVRFSGHNRARPFGLNRPGKRRYRQGMTYILRCDAVLNGYAAKASLAGPSEEPALVALQHELEEWRQALPATLAHGHSPQQLAARFPDVQQRHRLAPITGNLPEGNRIAEGALIPGLWQWQFSLSRDGHTVAGNEFLVMDDHGPRWLSQGADALTLDPPTLTQ